MTISADKIRTLINEENLPPKLFTEGNLKLETPVPSVGDGYNTKLPVSAVPGRGYWGEEEVFYKRINMAEVTRETPYRSTVTLTPEIVLQLINNTTGLFITPEDIEPFTPPVLLEGQSGDVVLVALSNSLGFTGTLTAKFEYGRAWLDVAVVQRNLTVLTHPIPVTDLKSARMLTWSKDFTPYRDSIAVVKGDYADWDAVQEIIGLMKIPVWAKGPITDLPTSAVPDSNPAFDRVVVQKKVVSDDMVGDVYLHYNNLEEI